MADTRINVVTYPFGKVDSKPLELLKDYDVQYNEVHRKYARDELEDVLKARDPHILIAGTEKYDVAMLDLMPNLKLISRVGIGVDAIDFEACKKRGVAVTNTPDAPSNAVAELVLGQMFNMLRRIQYTDKTMRERREKGGDRYVGGELQQSRIGVIGCGRIGSRIIKKLQSLEPKEIFANDIIKERVDGLVERGMCEYMEKDGIFRRSDIITIHIPYNKDNKNFVTLKDLEQMKSAGKIINMSRGGIVNEADLAVWLRENPDSMATIDTFEQEPYKGELIDLENCYITPHIGSCSEKSRYEMEVGAAEEVINCIKGRPYNNEVTNEK